MQLTDIKCKNAKSSDKPRKLSDGGGLYLEVMPNGSKYWRVKYRYMGKEKRLALGVYPFVSILEARELRNQAKRLLAKDVDPSVYKKQQKLEKRVEHENTLESITRQWHKAQSGKWSETHATRIIQRMEANVLYELGSLPITQITPQQLLSTIRKVEDRDALDVAKRCLQSTGQVFRYAIANGLADRDIAADLKGALQTRKVKNHAYLQENELPEFLKKLSTYNGDAITQLAFKLLILTFVRSGELRFARWDEFDLKKAEWRIPAERMKMKEQHIVPLSKQAIQVIQEIKLHSGKWDHLFPSQVSPRKCISENTLIYAVYRMGYHSRSTVHGFRSTASTILNETGFKPDVIERQLAHGERNKVRASYNHAQYLPERRQMMQWWGDYVEAAAKGKLIRKKLGKVA